MMNKNLSVNIITQKKNTALVSSKSAEHFAINRQSTQSNCCCPDQGEDLGITNTGPSILSQYSTAGIKRIKRNVYTPKIT